MSLTPENMESFFKAVQSNATPAVWSQAVTLNRGGTVFRVLSMSASEAVLMLKVSTQAVSPRVKLFFEEEDWDCDCSSLDSPCAHVAASVIALRRGELNNNKEASAVSGTASVASEDIAQLHYKFARSPQGLKVNRYLASLDGSKKALALPLVNYIAGVQSGRIEGVKIAASKADYALDQALMNYHGEPLDRMRLEALFKSFEAEQKIFLDDAPVSVSDARILVRYECLDEGEGYRIRRIKNPAVEETFPHGVVRCGSTLQLVAPTRLTPEERAWVDGEGTYWPPEREKYFCADILARLQRKVTVEISSIKLPQTLQLPPRVDLLLEVEKQAGGEGALSVLANVVYGDPAIYLLNPTTLQLSALDSRRSARTVIQRNPEAERSLMQKLARSLNLQIGRRVLLKGAEAIEFARRAEEWAPRGEGVANFKVEGRRLEPALRTSEQHGVSFHVDFSIQGRSEKAEVDFERVFRAWQAGEDNVPLLNGEWAQIPHDWMQKFGKRIREFLQARDAAEKLPNYRLPEFVQLCEEMGTDVPPSTERLKKLLANFKSIPEASLPNDLAAQLRVYQRQGVNWLAFLRDAGLGAMLADDMGLGKTLQMLCAIRGRTLIVAPTSVLLNWAQEIKKFRPSLKIALFYGSQRRLDIDADVVLTSYGVLRLDLPQLSEILWETIVLDEAQVIKNPESQVARAAHALKGNFRAPMSGTPVENSLDDLWSQFHFVNPGLLGGRAEFLEQYARPIGRGDNEVAQRLKSKIKPFILRRLKREVAPELPARTEMILRCELDTEERNTYDGILATTKQEVLRSLESGGSVLEALEVILRLRQACCHMALVPGQGTVKKSSKLDLLMETLSESLSEGHKSLIFSQWTSFLDLIAVELKERGISFSRIDGATQKRQDIVNEFQGPGGPPVMLISLKAGGVGLTLTAADHVFIMDPWWNPSVEDQAADRAHRIGQQNPVMIHKLIAENSIEEKIIELQGRKKDLAKSVLEDGHAALSLTKQDILDLLS